MRLPRNLLLRAAALASALIPALSCAAAAAAPPPTVVTASGAVSGEAVGGLNVFKGLPYAAPPVGPARWTPPAPPAPWSGVRPAREFGPACFQPVATFPGNIYADDLGPLSEDCLTLNIWAPAKASGAPVFVWIHGGALNTGSSREKIYDGAKLAARGLVVVTLNYRLGVFGYLAHPQLSAESGRGVSGNYGLLDQIEALRWVQRNISAFGGDPANVTIAGESAGGLSVMYLMAAPPARGLFSKAVAESAYMITTPALKTSAYGQPSAEAAGVHLAQALGAPGVGALRALSAADLTRRAAAAGFAPFGAVDGAVLPAQLVDVFDQGRQAPVPLLAGFNSGEIRSLRMLAPRAPATAAAYETTIRARYGDLAPDFLRLYPSATLEESILATTRDALYGWTAVRLVTKQAALGAPSFLYFFDHGYPAADGAGLHGFHGSEVPFVFGTVGETPPHWPRPPATPPERRISDALVSYWSSFARDGRPRAEGEADWPAFGPGGAYMAVREVPSPASDLLPGMYGFNERVVCRRRVSGDLPWNWNVGLLSPTNPPATPECAPRP